MLTVPEAARRTGKNPETIRRWIREGKLRAQKVGQQHMIKVGDLDIVTGQGGSRRSAEGPADYATAAQAHVGWESVPNEWLPAIVGRMVRIADPVRIVLFGARANGSAAPDAEYELVVVLDDAPDPMAASIALRRAFADLPVAADVLVASAGQLASGQQGSGRRALEEGRDVYAREALPPKSILQRLIDTGRATPPRNPDTSVLPATWPATTGMTATEALLTERREDPR